MRYFIFIPALFIFSTGFLQADTVLFKNGRVLRNVRATLGKKRVRVKTPRGTRYYPTASVKRVIIKPVNWKKKRPVKKPVKKPSKKEPVKKAVKKDPISKKKETPAVKKGPAGIQNLTWFQRYGGYFPVVGLYAQKRPWLGAFVNVLEALFLYNMYIWYHPGPSQIDNAGSNWLVLGPLLDNLSNQPPNAPNPGLGLYRFTYLLAASQNVRDPSNPERYLDREVYKERRSGSRAAFGLILAADIALSYFLNPRRKSSRTSTGSPDTRDNFTFDAGFDPVLERVDFGVKYRF